MDEELSNSSSTPPAPKAQRPPVAPPPPTPPMPPIGSTPGLDKPDVRRDNPLAVVALVTAVLALVLAVVIIGGLVAIAGLVLCLIALRKSRQGHGGTGIIVGAALLNLLAIAVSAGVVALAINELGRGEDVTIDGIVSSSNNDTFPPQQDLDMIECSTSNTGRYAQAVVSLTNRSEGASVYSVTIAWSPLEGATDAAEAESETVVSTASLEQIMQSEFVDPGESIVLEAIDLTGGANPESCEVIRIDRSGLPFFR